VLSVRLAAAIHYDLRAYAPTNILLRRLRSRDGIKWAIPVSVVLVLAYLYSMSLAGPLSERGGSGWLNLLVLLSFCYGADLVIPNLSGSRAVDEVGWSA